MNADEARKMFAMGWLVSKGGWSGEYSLPELAPSSLAAAEGGDAGDDEAIAAALDQPELNALCSEAMVKLGMTRSAEPHTAELVTRQRPAADVPPLTVAAHGGRGAAQDELVVVGELGRQGERWGWPRRAEFLADDMALESHDPASAQDWPIAMLPWTPGLSWRGPAADEPPGFYLGFPSWDGEERWIVFERVAAHPPPPSSEARPATWRGAFTLDPQSAPVSILGPIPGGLGRG